ncbi:restriction endonuclease subunit S [Vibrio tubiashii]|uniref:restriction endonuclease subunit S n=1 Tax=Vibrio tubiashii TaxID=29498 RepID=UPI00349E654B
MEAVEKKDVQPEGYRVTDAGVIPSDWRCLRIEQICNLINGRGFKPHEWGLDGLPIIRIQNLNGSQDFNFFDGAYDKKLEIEEGQLLFAWSGSRGTSFGPHIWHGQKALLNYHTWKVVKTDDSVDSQYFYFALKALTKVIEESAHGASALVHTQMGEMKKFVVPVPPTLKEQTAIANALSDVDALIRELDKLIVKKQAIKTATMQQLLTGKKRLPEFAKNEDGTPKGYKKTELGEIPNDWKVQPIRQLLLDVPRYGINAPAVPLTNGLPVYIRITDISESGYFSPVEKVGVKSQFSHMYELTDGDIVLARTGASVGKSYLYNPDDGSLVFAGFLIKVSPNTTVLNPKYLRQYLNTEQYWNWVKVNSMRSGQPGINGNEYGSLPIPLPSLTEQTAIASILSDMDEELQALEKRLKKTHQIKQGMMQELLTGKTRLLKPESK